MDCLFVGCGAIAREYADALPETPLRLAAVCDLDRDRATDLADGVAVHDTDSATGRVDTDSTAGQADSDGAAERTGDDSVAGQTDTDSVTGQANTDSAGDQAGAGPETTDTTDRPRVYTDAERMFASEDAPLVCVLTDHASHAAITRTALDAGRHVFSQKPLALDAAEARALVETAADRELALGCAPISPHNPAQRRVARLLAAERCGPVRLGYAHAHVGRVTEWHDRPASFLEVGPLYDGAVYPLTNLTAWFGPVERVRTADALDPWPPGERRPDGPTHYEATLGFRAGPVVRLTASFYAPHRSREFTSLELHGDDGSVYLADAGALADDPETVQFGPLGESYAPLGTDDTHRTDDARLGEDAGSGDGAVPSPDLSPSDRTAHLIDGPVRLAAAVERGERPRESARRAAHIVSVLNGIERAAETGDPVELPPVRGIERLAALASDDAGGGS